ncbi:MAG: hypothetical protein ACLRNQ_11045 [Flavonifractor plautii]
MKLLMTDRPVSAALPQDAAAVDLSALRIANCVGRFGLLDQNARPLRHPGRRGTGISPHRPERAGTLCQPGQIRLLRAGDEDHAGAGHSGASRPFSASTTARLTTFSAPWSPRTR